MARIEQVEMQAKLREAQAKVLSLRIRQMELMSLVGHAHRAAEFKEQELVLLGKKRELEQRIAHLEENLREQLRLQAQLEDQQRAQGDPPAPEGE